METCASKLEVGTMETCASKLEVGTMETCASKLEVGTEVLNSFYFVAIIYTHCKCNAILQPAEFNFHSSTDVLFMQAAHGQRKTLPATVKCKYFFVLVLVMVLLCSQTALTATKFLVKHELSLCKFQQQKQVQNNTVTSESITVESNTTEKQLTKQPESMRSLKHQKYFRLSHILYMFCNILTWFQYGYLFYGGYYFLRTASTWSCKFHESLLCHTQKFMLKKRIKLAVAFFCFALLTLSSLVPPILGIVAAMPVKQDCQQTITTAFVYAYHSSIFLTNTLAILVQMLMACFAVMCGAIWIAVPADDFDDFDADKRDIQVSLDKREDHRNKDWEKAGTEYFNCIADYEARLTKVRSIYKIFRSWFMIQWVTHLFLIFINLTYLLRPWLHNTRTMDNERHALYFFNNLLMLIWSYIFALKMNSYLRRYIRNKQKCQTERAKLVETGSKLWYVITDKLLPIEKIPKSDFTPNIPGTGIKISLGSPGFVLGTLLTVMGTVFTLTSF